MIAAARLFLTLPAILPLAIFEAIAAAEETERPPIYLKLDPCVPVQVTVVRRALAVEFGAQHAQVDAPTDSVTRVSVECADAQLWLRVDDPRTGKSLLRRLDLGSVDPSVRARLLGLAVAELVSVSWTEFSIDPESGDVAAAPNSTLPESTILPPQTVIIETPRRATESRKPFGDPWGLRLLAVTTVTAFFSGSGMLWGGGLRLGGSHRQHLGWVADLVAQHSSVGTSLGDVSVSIVNTSGALLCDWRWSRLALHLGGGLRGGIAYLNGQPLSPERVRGSSLLGLWGGPMLVASTSVKLPRRVVVEAHLEGGYALFSVIGSVSNSPSIGVAGGWVGGQIGIGLIP